MRKSDTGTIRIVKGLRTRSQLKRQAAAVVLSHLAHRRNPGRILTNRRTHGPVSLDSPAAGRASGAIKSESPVVPLFDARRLTALREVHTFKLGYITPTDCLSGLAREI